MKSKKLLIVLVILLTFISSVAVAWGTQSGQTTWNEAKEIYRIIKTVAIPLAGVGVAFCGIKMLTGGTDAMQKAKKTIIIILGAVIAIILLPSVVNQGASLGQRHKWNPRNPSEIENVEITSGLYIYHGTLVVDKNCEPCPGYSLDKWGNIVDSKGYIVVEASKTISHEEFKQQQKNNGQNK